MITIETFNTDGITVANENACDEQHAHKIVKERMAAGLCVSINGEDAFSLAGAFYAIRRAAAIEVAA